MQRGERIVQGKGANQPGGEKARGRKSQGRTSQGAKRCFMKFGTNMCLDNHTNHLEFLGHRSKVKVNRQDFWILYPCDIVPCCYYLLLGGPS